jgi:hypothetical protein
VAVEIPTRTRSRTSSIFIMDEWTMTTLDERMTTLKMMIKDVAG